MRLLKILFILICCVAAFDCAQSAPLLHDTNGNVTNTSNLKGKWVIINYWADWCESCAEETPELNHFYEHDKDKNVVIYGVNYDHLPPAELQAAIDKMQITYPIILEDPASIWPIPEFDALPATFIIDPKGHVVKKLMGENTEESLSSILHELQNKS